MELPQSLYELPRSLLGFHVALVKGQRSRTRAGSVEERLTKLEADRDIRTVINQYAYCYDEGDLDGLMNIYSDDCRLINNKGTFVGHAAIRDNYAQNIDERTMGFHHVTDIQIVLDTSATSAWASGFLYNVAVRDGAPTGTMASCLFHLAVRNDIWQVTESRIVISNRHRFLTREVPDLGTPAYATAAGTVADLIDDFGA
jgi:ketosteroid isomerase-like protein